jgi:hypothetical protein
MASALLFSSTLTADDDTLTVDDDTLTTGDDTLAIGGGTLTSDSQHQLDSVIACMTR